MKVQVGKIYRFKTGYRIVMSQPEKFKGEPCVEVAQPFIQLHPERKVLLSETGLPKPGVGRTWLPISSITHVFEIAGTGPGYVPFELVKIVSCHA